MKKKNLSERPRKASKALYFGIFNVKFNILHRFNISLITDLTFPEYTVTVFRKSLRTNEKIEYNILFKRRKIMRKFVMPLMAGLFALSLTACGSSTEETTTAAAADTTAAQTEADSAADTEAETETEEASADISGTISMVGSTSMEKFANALCESFMAKYPNVTATAEFVGSGAGIEAVTNGSADIGNASRALTDEEKANGISENIVAIDGIAVVVDPANTVENLTKQQLTDIYAGTVTNWSDVGGEDAPIVVVGREAGSGTRSAFEELLGLEDACVYSNELDSTGAVMARVASTPGAIGYVSLDVLDDSVKALNLDDVAPTEENIKAGDYFLSRPFVMATKGTIDEQNDVVKALFDYISSPEGQEIVKSVGLITVE